MRSSDFAARIQSSLARPSIWFAALALLGHPAYGLASDVEAGAHYRQHCSACHGTERLGAIGPALLPENLERLRKPAAEQVIAQGRTATQMPGFADKLSAAQIKQLVDYIFTPPLVRPVW